MEGSGTDRPPRMSVTTPGPGPVGSNLVIEVLAIDDRPGVVIEFDALSTEPADVTPTLTEGPPEPVDEISSLRRITLAATQAVEVAFTVIVSDSAGHEIEQLVRQSIRALPPPASDGIGPRVVFHWPSAGAVRVPDGTPIELHFSQPLHPDDLAQRPPTWLALGGGARVTHLRASADRQRVTIHYLDAGPEISYSVNDSLRGESGAPFDQDSTADGNQTFSAGFAITTAPRFELGALRQAGGVVLNGGFAYALDRTFNGGYRGDLIAWDLSDPENPDVASRTELPGTPTAIVLIPDHSLPVHGGDCVVGDFIAVYIGGPGQEKFLRVYPIRSDGRVGDLLFGALIDANPAAQTWTAKWDAPFLAHVSLASDVTAAHFVNLSAASLGYTTPPLQRAAAYPVSTLGTDLNLDGDYCDPGEEPPHPEAGFAILGLEYSFAPDHPHEPIQDLDFDSTLGLVGIVTFDAGARVGYYYTALSSVGTSIGLHEPLAFPDELPKRLLLLPSQRLLLPDGGETVRDLALVSFAGGSVAVLDITNPTRPEEVTRLRLPESEGSANSIIVRADGLLALQGFRSQWLLDPTRLLLPAAGTELGPAFGPGLAGLGGGVRSFVSEPSGYVIAAAGDHYKLAVGPPTFEFLSFENAPLTGDEIAGLAPEEITTLLTAARSHTRLHATSLAGPNAYPPSAARSYYVRVHAPGAAGATLALALATLDRNGRPRPSSLRHGLPNYVGDLATTDFATIAGYVCTLKKIDELVSSTSGLIEQGVDLAAGESNLGLSSIEAMLGLQGSYARILETSQALKRERFVAYRLSDEPTEAAFNQYIAGPFSLVHTPPQPRDIADGRLEEIENDPGRVLLQAGPLLAVSLAKTMGENPVVGAYASDTAFEFGRSDFTSTDALLTQIYTVLASPNKAAAMAGLATDLACGVNYSYTPAASKWIEIAGSDRPLIFVPGVMASELVEADGTVHWGGIAGALPGRIRELAVNPDGSPMDTPEVHAPDIVRSVAGADIQGRFLESFKLHGYTEYPAGQFLRDLGAYDRSGEAYRAGELAHAIAASTGTLPTLFPFPYDWRLDNEVSAAKLADYIDFVLALHPDADGVDLVGHSMGGLVSRRYLLNSQSNRDRVKRFISIGTPWLGAPKALMTSATGDPDDLALDIFASHEDFRTAMSFMEGPMQLFPNRGAFDIGIRPLRETGWDMNRNGIDRERYDFAQYLGAIENHFMPATGQGHKRWPENIQTNHPVARVVADFHVPELPDHSDDNEADWPETHHFFGMQKDLLTINQVELRTFLDPVVPTNDHVVLGLANSDPFESDRVQLQDRWSVQGRFDNTPLQYRLATDYTFRPGCGDGTVPLWSAARAHGSEADLNAAHAHVYPFLSVTPREAASGAADHVQMLKNPVLLDQLMTVLNGGTVTRVDLAIDGPTEVAEGDTVSFRASANGLTYTDENLPSPDYTYVWDFGDGTTFVDDGTTSEIDHRFDNDGTYIVSVGVRDQLGHSAYRSLRMEVENESPAVVIVGANQVGIGDSAIYAVEIDDPGPEDLHDAFWDLDNDGATDAGVAHMQVLNFDRVGSHTFSVEVKDDGGGSATATKTVQVVASPAARSGQKELAKREKGPAQLPPATLQQLEVRLAGHNPSNLGSVLSPGGTDQLITAPGGIGVYHDDVAIYTALKETFLQRIGPLRSHRGADQATTVFVGRHVGPGGEATAATTLRFASAKAVAHRDQDVTRPLSLDVKLRNGGEVERHYHWNLSPEPDTAFELEVDWTDGSMTLEGRGITARVLEEGVGRLMDATAPLHGVRVFSPRLAAELLGLVDAFEPDHAAAGEAARIPPRSDMLGVRNEYGGDIFLTSRSTFDLVEAGFPAPGYERFLFGLDLNGDGRYENEIFHPLSRRNYHESIAPGQAMAILHANDAGLHSRPQHFDPRPALDPHYTWPPTDPAPDSTPPVCDDLGAIRTALRYRPRPPGGAAGSPPGNRPLGARTGQRRLPLGHGLLRTLPQCRLQADRQRQRLRTLPPNPARARVRGRGRPRVLLRNRAAHHGQHGRRLVLQRAGPRRHRMALHRPRRLRDARAGRQRQLRHRQHGAYQRSALAGPACLPRFHRTPQAESGPTGSAAGRLLLSLPARALHVGRDVPGAASALRRRPRRGRRHGPRAAPAQVAARRALRRGAGHQDQPDRPDALPDPRPAANRRHPRHGRIRVDPLPGMGLAAGQARCSLRHPQWQGPAPRYGVAGEIPPEGGAKTRQGRTAGHRRIPRGRPGHPIEPPRHHHHRLRRELRLLRGVHRRIRHRQQPRDRPHAAADLPPGQAKRSRREGRLYGRRLLRRLPQRHLRPAPPAPRGDPAPLRGRAGGARPGGDRRLPRRAGGPAGEPFQPPPRRPSASLRRGGNGAHSPFNPQSRDHQPEQPQGGGVRGRRRQGRRRVRHHH